MSAGAIRVGAAIFVIGLLFVWLIRPLGNPCGDLDKLPAGSTAASKPSFAPPLTRTCTYTTPEATQARKRYVPVVDWLLLAVIAGLVAGAATVLGPGSRDRPRAPRPEREPRARRARNAPQAAAAHADRADAEVQHERDEAQRERDAAERERARREREARRRR